MLDERDLKLNGMPAILRALTTLEQHFVALEARMNDHVREAHLHMNELTAPGLPLGESRPVKLSPRAPFHHRWQDRNDVWHDDLIGLGTPIGEVILQDVDGMARIVPLFEAGPDTPMLNAKAAYEAQLASLTGPALSPEARAKQRADLVATAQPPPKVPPLGEATAQQRADLIEDARRAKAQQRADLAAAAEAPAHTVRDDFEHFLSYSGFGNFQTDTIELLRVAFEAGTRPSEPNHRLAVEIELRICEKELNLIRDWLQGHGFAPGVALAAYTVQVLDRLQRDSNTAELDLLRKIVDHVAPVIAHKANASQHDPLSRQQYWSIHLLINALRGVQSARHITPIMEDKPLAATVPPVVDPILIADLKRTYYQLSIPSNMRKGLKAYLMEHGVPYAQAQAEAGDF